MSIRKSVLLFLAFVLLIGVILWNFENSNFNIVEHSHNPEHSPELIEDREIILHEEENQNALYPSNSFQYDELDMEFEENVKAKYMNSNLFAEKAEYSNSKNYLSIYENVKIDDNRGNLVADKLLFDISKQELDITSFNDGNINDNVNLDEKRF